MTQDEKMLVSVPDRAAALRVGKAILEAHGAWETENVMHGGQAPWCEQHCILLGQAAMLEALSAAPAQPAAVEGAALSASDRACYEYLGEDQAALRAAFVGGACFVADNPPSTPALDEGAAGEPVAWRFRWRGEHTDRPWRWAFTKAEAIGAELRGYEVRPVFDHPSPTAAAEAASRNNVTSGDEVCVKAKASDVCTSCCGVCIPTIHERDANTYVHWSSVSLSPTPAADADEMAKAVERLKADADYFDHPEDGAETHRRALCWVARDIRTVLGLAALKSTPPADDALRVAVEKALEPFAKGGHHRTMPGLPPSYTVADFGDGIVVTVADFRRAAEALAALKAEKK